MLILVIVMFIFRQIDFVVWILFLFYIFLMLGVLWFFKIASKLQSYLKYNRKTRHANILLVIFASFCHWMRRMENIYKCILIKIPTNMYINWCCVAINYLSNLMMLSHLFAYPFRQILSILSRRRRKKDQIHIFKNCVRMIFWNMFMFWDFLVFCCCCCFHSTDFIQTHK